jgi:hypothetical protein
MKPINIPIVRNKKNAIRLPNTILQSTVKAKIKGSSPL